jgi:hypothetical protein
MSGSLSWADTYKCTRPDGSIFFTDDLSQVPKGCAIERVENLRPIGKPPEPPVNEAPMPDETPVFRTEDATPPQVLSHNMRLFKNLKSQAVRIGDEYQALRRKLHGYSYVKDDIRTKQELSEIRKQAELLRDEINESPLSSSEKQELESLLPPAPE